MLITKRRLFERHPLGAVRTGETTGFTGETPMALKMLDLVRARQNDRIETITVLADAPDGDAAVEGLTEARMGRAFERGPELEVLRLPPGASAEAQRERLASFLATPRFAFVAPRLGAHADELLDLVRQAEELRAVGATSANEQSSRSHAILQVVLRERETGRAVGKLSLVDLAGSERLSRTEAMGALQLETAAINKSLSALGDVMSAIAAKDGHVPYRNSLLTAVLRDSLGGNCNHFFGACSPLLQTVMKLLNKMRHPQVRPGDSSRAVRRALSPPVETDPSWRKARRTWANTKSREPLAAA